MKYIVTGGCGFVGTNLINYLLNNYEGCEVVIVDNLLHGDESNKHPKAELVVENITDYSVAASVCRDADVVIHLAAETGVIPSVENPKLNFEANAIGVFNYLEASRFNKVKRFVFASSGSALGDQEPPIHENKVPKPLSPYGAGKLTGEAYCNAYYESFGLETVALRFSNVYGAYSHNKESLVSKFIKHAIINKPFPIYGDGAQTRDLIYVKDLMRAIMSATSKPNIGGEVFQISSGISYSVTDIIDKLNALCKKHINEVSVYFEDERKGEIKVYEVDTTKALSKLGFRTTYDLDTGLEETVKWFKEVT